MLVVSYMKTKILISAANGVVMKSLIRELRKNFYVIGIDNSKQGDADKYCDEFYSSPDGNDNKFFLFLNKIEKKVDFIFLFVDEEIRVINKQKISKKLKNKLILSDKRTLNVCLNKKKFYNFCIKNKINIPSDSYSKNMIAKPIFGRGSRDIYILKNKFEYNFFKKNKNYIVQKFVEGKEYTIDCLFDSNGKLIFGLPRLRIVHKGVSIIGKIIKDTNLITFVELISKKLKFFGPINIQVIKDKNNKIWALEINPRLSGSIEFSIKAGFNPLIYFSKNKKKFSSIKYNKIYKRSFVLN